MTKEDFFEKIRNESGNNVAFIIELLKLRGFLFEEKNNKHILSDNSHMSDYRYLNDLLVKYNLGEIVDRKIVIYDTNCTEFIQMEFRENNQIGSPSCWQNRDWRYFKRREHGEKAAVSWLEPFIARYIKAISACCVLTVGSCDGNHPKKDKMFIMTEGEGSITWHRLICEKCLVGKYDIDWINNYTAMRFCTETKYATYYQVNKAAEYLYAHRREIRKIKDSALQGMSNSYLRNQSSEVIEKEFILRTSELFDSSNL